MYHRSSAFVRAGFLVTSSASDVSTGINLYQEIQASYLMACFGIRVVAGLGEPRAQQDTKKLSGSRKVTISAFLYLLFAYTTTTPAKRSSQATMSPEGPAVSGHLETIARSKGW